MSVCSSEIVHLLERVQDVFIVFDNNLVTRLRDSERRITLRVAGTTAPAQALFEHAQQHRRIAVNIVEDTDLVRRGMEAVQTASVLGQCPLPQRRQRQEERIEPLLYVVPPRWSTTTWRASFPN